MSTSDLVRGVLGLLGRDDDSSTGSRWFDTYGLVIDETRVLKAAEEEEEEVYQYDVQPFH